MSRLFLCGSGIGAFSLPQVCDQIIQLAREIVPEGIIKVAYLGTATYDLDEPMQNQTALLRQAGCEVQSVKIALTDEYDKSILTDAHVILGSGGNTLFAMDRFKQTGVDVLLKEAFEKGTVLTGGSAGAIMYFDGGLSDSADPTSFKRAMVDNEPVQDTTSWEYIRVSALGMIPGLCCPHLDQTQSNGSLRASVFEEFMLKNSGETGVGVDHWAALLIKGNSYQVVAMENKPGSVSSDGHFVSDQTGVPGVWIYKVVDGKLERKLASQTGSLDDLTSKATNIIIDPREQQTRELNVL